VNGQQRRGKKSHPEWSDVAVRGTRWTSLLLEYRQNGNSKREPGTAKKAATKENSSDFLRGQDKGPGRQQERRQRSWTSREQVHQKVDNKHARKNELKVWRACPKCTAHKDSKGHGVRREHASKKEFRKRRKRVDGAMHLRKVPVSKKQGHVMGEPSTSRKKGTRVIPRSEKLAQKLKLSGIDFAR